jgi:hypothetical protein
MTLLWTRIILDVISKIKATKTKIDKWHYMKPERFCIVNKVISKLKRKLYI